MNHSLAAVMYTVPRPAIAAMLSVDAVGFDSCVASRVILLSGSQSFRKPEPYSLPVITSRGMSGILRDSLSQDVIAESEHQLLPQQQVVALFKEQTILTIADYLRKAA